MIYVHMSTTKLSNSELYDELIDLIENSTIKENIRKEFTIEKVRENYEAALKFCELISTEMILDFLNKCQHSSYSDTVNKQVMKILQYRSLCRTSSDALIYSCFFVL